MKPNNVLINAALAAVVAAAVDQLEKDAQDIAWPGNAIKAAIIISARRI